MESDEQKKTITPTERLAAFGIFTLAVQHYAKCRQYEEALARHLGFGDEGGNFGLSFLSDRIYSEEAGIDQFDDALSRDGITVAKP